MMPEKLQPTYVPFLDKLLGGGTAPQGVYGVLGPTGIGKTHLASMIACNGATKGSIFECRWPNAPPWILFDLESHFAISRQRILSHCARVSRGNIDSENMKEQAYEKLRCSELPKLNGVPLNEENRAKLAKEVLERNLILRTGDDLRSRADVASSDESEDITSIITKCIATADLDVNLGGIVIDGVNNAWSLSGNSNSRHERRFILDFVGTFCRGLAEEYRCPVWVTHQVNGTACNASPLTRLSHSNAARCKGFADSLDACFVLGNSTDENFFAIQCTKGNPDRASLDQLVLTHDRDFASIIEVENTKTNVRHQTWNVPSENSALLNAEELLYIEQLIAKLP